MKAISRFNLAEMIDGRMSAAVIGMPGKNCYDPIELLASHHPNQLMGPGHLAETQYPMRPTAE